MPSGQWEHPGTLIFPVQTPVSYTHLAETDIKLYINGEELITDPSAVVQNDRLMVPFRAIFEKLGATVNWDAEKETVMAVKDSSVMLLQVNTPTLFLNTEQIALDSAPIIVNDYATVSYTHLHISGFCHFPTQKTHFIHGV